MITLTYTVAVTFPKKTVIMKPAILLKPVILHVPSSAVLEIGNVNAKASNF